MSEYLLSVCMLLISFDSVLTWATLIQTHLEEKKGKGKKKRERKQEKYKGDVCSLPLLLS